MAKSTGPRFQKHFCDSAFLLFVAKTAGPRCQDLENALCNFSSFPLCGKNSFQDLNKKLRLDFSPLCGQKHQKQQQSSYNFRQRDERRCITGEERRQDMYIFSRIMTVSKTMRPSKQTRIFSNISSSHSSLKQVLVFIRSSSIAIFGPNSIKPNEECVILGITYFQKRIVKICKSFYRNVKTCPENIFAAALSEIFVKINFVTFPSFSYMEYDKKLIFHPLPDSWNSLFIKAPIEKYIPTFPIPPSGSMSLLCLILPLLLG